MPKSARKRKEKNADFTKAKLKLGKGKQPASNATDTSFKARSVVLPKQSISIVKDESVPTTRRNLAFDELLSQMKHYNASVRKDAITGMKELLSENHELIEPSLAALINRCVALISDEACDAMVRKLLLSFLSWILPLVPNDMLSPHVPVVLLFSASALSHIFPEIRVDAIRFIDILLDLVPDKVVGNWTNSDTGPLANRGGETSASGSSSSGRWILEGYLALLDVNSSAGENAVGAMSTLALSPNSKLIIMKSFSRFLHVTLARGSSRGDSNAEVTETSGLSPAWFLEDVFASPVAFSAFNSSLAPSSELRECQRMQWRTTLGEGIEFHEEFVGRFPLANLDESNALNSWSLNDLHSAVTQLGPFRQARAGAHILAISELAQRVAPLLVSTFLDYAPSVFSPSNARAPSSPSIGVGLIAVVGDIARTLYGAVAPRAHDLDDAGPNTVNNLRKLLGYMAVYFPFGSNSASTRDPRQEQLLHELSLAYCELTALLALTMQKSRTTVKPAAANKLNDEMERVGDYVIQTLQGQVATASQPLGRRLSAGAYVSLLPTIWSLLNLSKGTSTSTEDTAIAARVFDVTLQHAMQTGALTAVKPVATDFVARLYLIHADATFRGVHVIKSGGTVSQRLVEWMLTVPRLLWELGTRDLVFTERLLLFLVRVFQRRKNVMDTQERAELRRRLCPYLSVRHPSKGLVKGPYNQLAPPLRRRFLDVVWISTPGDNFDELEEKVSDSIAGTEDEDYWRYLRGKHSVV